MINLTIKVTFIEEMLGMTSANKNIHEEYIASKAPDALSRAEEIAAIGVDAEVEKMMTVFPRDEEGNPIIWDYQIKGFFKDACGMLRRVKDTKCSKVKAFKKEIDGLLFIEPRKIVLDNGGVVGNCQRTLRVSGPAGERNALANSETVPEGTSFICTITLLKDDMREWVEECLDYGKLRGLGQWRNSGKGKFLYEVIDVTDTNGEI